jgi:hypothetical protein
MDLRRSEKSERFFFRSHVHEFGRKRNPSLRSLRKITQGKQDDERSGARRRERSMTLMK